MISGIQNYFEHKCVVKARKRGDNSSDYGQGNIRSNMITLASKSNKVFLLQCLKPTT